MYSYMYDRLNPHLTLSHVLNHCDKSSHQPSCSECYVQIFLLVSTRNNMMVLPTKRQKSPVYVCQISCPSTGIHVHALISMFGTQSFLPKKTRQKEKENSFIEDEMILIIFHTLLSTLMWTPVSNLPLKRPINLMEKEESICKISKGDVQKAVKLMVVSSIIIILL